jgi:hypothetical protein
MASFHTQNSNLGKFWRALDWTMILFLWRFGIFYGDLEYFMTFWYILYSFGTFFPVSVSCTNKNLAALPNSPPCDNEIRKMAAFISLLER